ncbi:response regulator transcription factor [Alkalicoccus urumqiensis]|uniref:DNA-binding response regulator n=1 Tax=Alkalicoccus urumqiensis TaxID=1548213 RepID=A0A2P6ML51_ALKUR|nr:response regulator [Alkalicoccus urumqiensis]PRO66995.1 hypothetical protein C6I21_00045 [Alkalicoccus urumqiensis]
MKHKVLIVEDEPLEREALKQLFQTEWKTMEVIGEASSGRQAVELADLYHPDIITMDMQLPGMNGLDTMKAIMEQEPGSSFVVISAYDTFTYVKQAMTLGVQDYLLKPYDITELIETIDTVAERRQKKQRERMEQMQLKDQAGQMQVLVEKELVDALVHPHTHDFSKTQLQEMLGIQFTDALPVVMTFPPELPMDAVLYQQVKQLVKQKLPCLAGAASGQQLPLLCYEEERSSTPLRIRVSAVWKQLLRETEWARAVSFGASAPAGGMDRLPAAFQEAAAASAQADRGVLHFYKPASGRADDALEQAGEAFLQAVRHADFAGAEASMAQWKTALQKDHVTPEQARAQAVELSVMTGRRLQPVPLQPLGMFFQAAEKEAVAAQAEKQLTFLLTQLKEQYEQQKEGTMKRFLHYLETHFDEEMTLEEAAASVHMSPAYFSRQFKEASGRTFVDYITQLRVDSAKEYLRTTNRSLKEIGSDVGYKDPNYFSRVFRKTTGLSPSQYRQRQNGEPET